MPLKRPVDGLACASGEGTGTNRGRSCLLLSCLGSLSAPAQAGCCWQLCFSHLHAGSARSCSPPPNTYSRLETPFRCHFLYKPTKSLQQIEWLWSMPPKVSLGKTYKIDLITSKQNRGPNDNDRYRLLRAFSVPGTTRGTSGTHLICYPQCQVGTFYIFVVPFSFSLADKIG